MQLKLENFKENPTVFMRSLGYSFDGSTRSSTEAHPKSSPQADQEWSFVKRISGEFPRYHAYVHLEEILNPKSEIRNLIINLHIDQKKPSYAGVRAHAGEYDGPLVEQECVRIKGRLVA